MQTVAGVFHSPEAARAAAGDLLLAGFSRERLTLLYPGATHNQIHSMPESDTEQPGVGAAFGGVLGGALGAAGGFELGIFGTAMIPGIGPVVAVGIAAAAILGAGGLIAGAELGGAADRNSTEGVPADEVFFYEDALRQGRSVVILLAESDEEAARAHELLTKVNAESIDAARQAWWIGLKDVEAEHYRALGHNFEQDEDVYRAGFEAALRRECRGKSVDESADCLKWWHPNTWDSEAFRRGFDRGRAFLAARDGSMYTFAWINVTGELEKEMYQLTNYELPCPMREDPLHLIPADQRVGIIGDLMRNGVGSHHVQVEGDLCPSCRQMYRELIRRYKGDWLKVMEHVRVRRFVLSEKDRIGIGTFQPKDEKNQDSTELTGDINYRKIAIYGSDSDARAFNFDGEFNVANRGIIEFIEVLKLEVAFLYDLLGASQEHKIKPKKFPQTDIDEVIIGHTNEPEYRKLQNNEFMEALRDRTVKIDIPYITKLSDEIKIYEKDYNTERIRGKHIAPHTIEIAAMWAVLTRLEQPKKANLTVLQKLKLYDGKTLAGYTEDSIKELQRDASREGMEGVSPRYIQDKISNALVNEQFAGCVNPFMVLNELESGLRHHSLIKSDDQRKTFRELLTVVKHEYEDIVKNEVQRAISADEEAISRLCSNYIDNVKAYTQKERVKNKYTGQDEEPDERLMRSIEEKIDIPESRKDDFRREIMNYIGALSLDGKQFNYRTNERLYKALELKLFEDRKDSIKLTSLVSNVVDKETQEKIDVVKGRLIKNYGYCDVCSTDVLNYVASIFARGDAKE